MESEFSTTKKSINFTGVNQKLLIINGLLLLAFFGAQVVITSRYGTKTQEIDSTRAESDQVRQQNKYIEAEIDKSKTYSATQDVISKYGLVQKTTTFVDDANFDSSALKVN